MKLGVIGDGSVGSKLARLLAEGGHEVIVGAHQPTAAQRSYAQAAASAQVIVLAIPYHAAASTLASILEHLEGKVVIDVTNPLKEDWSPLELEGGRSAAELNQALIPKARIVKAFNTIFADAMVRRPDAPAAEQTAAFLCGDDPQARQVVATLAKDAGFAPVDAGPLSCARYLEAMAHLNIQLAVAMGGGTRAVFSYHTIAAPQGA